MLSCRKFSVLSSILKLSITSSKSSIFSTWEDFFIHFSILRLLEQCYVKNMHREHFCRVYYFTRWDGFQGPPAISKGLLRKYRNYAGYKSSTNPGNPLCVYGTMSNQMWKSWKQYFGTSTMVLLNRRSRTLTSQPVLGLPTLEKLKKQHFNNLKLK